MAHDKEYQRQYRLKNRERLASYKKAWVESNLEKVKEDNKNRYLEKKDAIKAYVASSAQ